MTDDKLREAMVEEKIWEGEDLKPCPFCGNKTIYYQRYRTKVGMRYRITCGNCLAGVDTGYSQNRYSVREIWNRRAVDETD